LQCPRDIAHRDSKGARHGSIDVEVKLRAARAESGEPDAQKTWTVARDTKNFLHQLLQIGETSAAAIFNYHLKPESIA